MQKKLKAIGAKSISALVDVTNYTTFDLGRPAHVFDADSVKGNIVIRDAKKGEKMLALDEETYELLETAILIAFERSISGAHTSSVKQALKTVALLEFLFIAYLIY